MTDPRLLAWSPAGEAGGLGSDVAPQYPGMALKSAMEEILGRDDLDAVLMSASDVAPSPRPPASATGPGSRQNGDGLPPVDGLLRVLEARYGIPGGRGLALRIGRACFRYGLRDYGTRVASIDQAAFRLLPLPARIRSTLGRLAQHFNEQMGQHVRLEDQDVRLIWRIEHCPLCGKRESSEPICYPVVGFLQEVLSWLSGGRIFRVEEIACRGLGDPACSFLIDPAPIA